MHTTQAVCETTGLNIWSIYNAIRTGAIKPSRKLGRSYVWTDADIEKLKMYLNQDEKENHEP